LERASNWASVRKIHHWVWTFFPQRRKRGGPREKKKLYRQTNCAWIIYLNKILEKVGLIFLWKRKKLFHSGSLKPLSLFHLSKGKKIKGPSCKAPMAPLSLDIH
jgi:hypothetical protein